MTYKGYTAKCYVDEAAGMIVGHLIVDTDIVTFQGDTVASTVKAFHDSVDDYIEFCAQRGEQPNQPVEQKQ